LNDANFQYRIYVDSYAQDTTAYPCNFPCSGPSLPTRSKLLLLMDTRRMYLH